MLVRAHGVRRLMDDGLTAEEFRLAGAHDQHDHNTDQDQPEAEDQHESDTADAGAAAILRARAVSQGDNKGVWAPTAAASKPSVAVSVYAGATEEIPSMMPPNRPTTLLFKPFSAISSTLLEFEL
jgi:hypothetical protein